MSSRAIRIERIALRMLGREAAASASTRHATRRGWRTGSTWVPVAMRWRRLRARTREATRRAALGPRGPEWYLTLHFHFSAGIARPERGAQAGSLAPRTAILSPRAERPRRRLADRVAPWFTGSVAHPRPPVHSRLIYRPPSPVNRALFTGSPRATPPAQDRWSDSPVPHRAAHRGLLPPSNDSARARSSRFASYRRSAALPISSAVAPERSRRSVGVPEIPSPLSHRRRTRPAPDSPLPELTWRAAAPAATDASASRQRADVQASHTIPARSYADIADERARASERRTASERAKPTRLSDLDPTLVDRLADDVIRRVERRVRIERERRGL